MMIVKFKDPVTLAAAQPLDAAMVQLTTYVPTELALGVIVPELEFILKPDGLALQVPPVVPN